MLEIINLNKSFKKGDYTLNVLNNFCLKVDDGERVAIVGPSGAGKSTLLQIIGGLDKPDSGSVVFNGDSVFDKKGRQLDRYRNSAVGFVFQFHYLLEDFTALENVMIPALIAGENRGDAKKRAEDLLARVGLSDRSDHFPTELSGGEQQRTSIARALMNNPKMILADEPTGSLDRKNSEEVFSMFDLMKQDGITVLIVTHDESIADACDRKIEMEKS
ncbi:ABC transporter ATP-binding protein [Deferribacteres bacterium DY0037]|uniref:ABC transporter ATP-binding protein n=1 Tax=Denitrovibrio acetiphilus TaxID=118000 RepID=UPI00059C6487|nr:ABC transporter ATP-binding protein [Denitrovibrio acetiphilus]